MHHGSIRVHPGASSRVRSWLHQIRIGSDRVGSGWLGSGLMIGSESARVGWDWVGSGWLGSVLASDADRVGLARACPLPRFWSRCPGRACLPGWLPGGSGFGACFNLIPARSSVRASERSTTAPGREKSQVGPGQTVLSPREHPSFNFRRNARPRIPEGACNRRPISGRQIDNGGGFIGVIQHSLNDVGTGHDMWDDGHKTEKTDVPPP